MKPSKDFITHVPRNRKPSEHSRKTSRYARVAPRVKRHSVLVVAWSVPSSNVTASRFSSSNTASSSSASEDVVVLFRNVFASKSACVRAFPSRIVSRVRRRAFSHSKSSDAYATRVSATRRATSGFVANRASMNASPSRHGFCSRKLSRKSCVLVMRAAARVLSVEPSAASGASVGSVPPGVLMEGATVSVWSITIHVAMYVIIVESMREACRSGVVPPNAPGGTYILSSPSNSHRVVARRDARVFRRRNAKADAANRRDARRGSTDPTRMRNPRWACARARLDIFDVLRRGARARSGVIGRCYVTPERQETDAKERSR